MNLKIAKHNSIEIISRIASLAAKSFAMMAFFSGCNKFVEIPDAPNKVPTSAVFADSADATAAVLGSYIELMSISSQPSFINGQVTVCMALASDEIYPSSPPSSDYLQYYVNGVAVTGNSKNSLFWSKGYTYIYQANACIEGLNASSSLSTSLKNQLLGESMVFRALCYFYLVNLYGPVPLVTVTDYHATESLPRTATDSIYQQIITDLTTAEGLLTVNYPSSGRIRANQYVAAALLAKVYLFHGDWAKAEAEASKVINSGLYSLVSDLNNVFLAGSQEAIWQLTPLQSGYETADGMLFIPGSGYNDPTTTVPAFALNNWLLSAFEPGDLRRTKWVDSNNINAVTYFYPYKYKLAYDGSSQASEYYMLLRLADLYLIRAEAEAEQSEGTSQSDLNQVRQRAGLPAYNGGNDKISLLKAIYHERQVEFFCEMGNRWFDLLRSGNLNTIMDTVTPAKGGLWSLNWQLFPVPQTEINNNPYLAQNPGYN